MRLTVATWNINSVRLRLGLVERFVAAARPDLLCLQETKCPNDCFPLKALRGLGYEHIAVNGIKGYHGVAILSRFPFAEIDSHQFCRKADGRHLTVRFGPEAGPLDGLVLHNLYVPAGGDLADPDENPKFAHKLAFLDEMGERYGVGAHERTVLVGDLNVAPLEHDVWSHRQMLDVVSHTPVEVDGLNRILDGGRWIDAMRAFVPPERKLYTWWSYRAQDWIRSDRGRRLDHVWASPDLAPALTDMRVHRDARGWERPSDHVPVTLTLDLA